MATMTVLQRQLAREEASIDDALKVLDHRRRQRQIEEFEASKGNGPGSALVALARVYETRQQLNCPRILSQPEQLALVARHLEDIVAAKHPQTGEVVSKTKRVVSLIDVMLSKRQIEMGEWHAGNRYKSQFFTYMGASKGISAYGEYVEAAPAHERCNVTQTQIIAGAEVRAATVAAFGVPREDGRWAVDEQLMQLVIPAIVSEDSEITQAWLGRERTRYKGAMQIAAAGCTVMRETLQRLMLHYCYRDR